MPWHYGAFPSMFHSMHRDSVLVYISSGFLSEIKGVVESADQITLACQTANPVLKNIKCQKPHLCLYSTKSHFPQGTFYFKVKTLK